MSQLQDLKVKITLDNKAFNSGIADTQAKVSSSTGDMTKKLATLATGIATCFAVKVVVNFGKECLNAASKLQEMESKFNTVFKTTSDSMKSWAGDYADAIGRSQTEIMTAISNQSDLMIGMGMTEDVAGDLSKKYTELAYDLGSFNNVNDAAALDAMTKAMFGETEAAKSLGLNLNVTTMKQSEYVKSLGKSWESLTQAEKAEAYYQEALKQSVNAIGDAERTSGSYANQMKRLESAKTRLYEVIGTQLLPIFTPLVTAIGDAFTNTASLIDKFFEAYNATGSFADGLEAIGVNTELVMPYFELLGQVFDEVFNNIILPVISLFQRIGKSLFDLFLSLLPKLQETWAVVMEALAVYYYEVLQPVFEFFMDILGQLWSKFEEYFPEIQRIFTEVCDVIQSIWESVLKPAFYAIGEVLEKYLFPVFQFIFENGILPLIDSVFSQIIDLWDNNLKPAFEGIISFIQNIFAGNWSAAWSDIVGVFKNVFGGIEKMARAPINAVIDMINGLINGLNKLQIPDWVPLIGGKGINIPNIPKLWKGTNFTLGGPTIVGEHGPELVNMPRGANVLPAHKTKSVMSASYAPQQQASSSANIFVELDGNVIARAIGEPLLDTIRLKTGYSF